MEKEEGMMKMGEGRGEDDGKEEMMEMDERRRG